MTDIGSDEDIRAAARAWLLRIALDEPTQRAREEFQSWYAASERHATAYRQVEQAWTDAAALQDLRHLVGSRPPASTGAVCRRMVQSCREIARSLFVRSPFDGVRARAAVASLLVASVATALVIWAFGRPLHYETGVAEVRDVTLPDGSVLTLGGRTAVDVRFNADRRHATLREGEVFLSVHPDPQRPFLVAVGNTEIRVVGTKFDVRRGDEQIQVSVLEGVVEVRQTEAGREAGPPAAAPSPPASKVLSRDQQLTATVHGELGDARRVGAAVAGGWRTGRRVYIDTPLREIVADANRYSRQQIVLDDAELAQLRVSVSFRAENLQQMFNGLALALPLEIERRQADRIVLHARPEAHAH